MLFHSLIEFRFLLESVGGMMTIPARRYERRLGGRRPVLVLPGMGASALSTYILRSFLGERDYAVEDWGHGTNRGPQEGLLDALTARVQFLHESTGMKPIVIGHSLGGTVTKYLSVRVGEHIHKAFTLGSPLVYRPEFIKGWQIAVFEAVTGMRPDAPEVVDLFNVVEQQPQCPFFSLYSKTDGVVPHQDSLVPGAHGENWRVRGSHIGLPMNREVLVTMLNLMVRHELT